MLRRAAFLVTATLVTGAAGIDTGTDIKIRLDTTFRETLGFRVAAQDPALLDQPNGDDGDRAFRPGLVSSRVDVVSQLDVSQGDLGFSLSGQGWYDPVYQARDDGNSPATFNPVSVPYDQHPADVRALQGGSAELLDGFVHDRFSIAGRPLSVRIGRQTLLWGESLFFADNGIAAGMAPVDAIKAAADPLAEAREVFLPVAQAEASLELRPGLVLQAYDQFEWRPDRLPGVTSYFSTVDFLDVGGQRLLLPDGHALGRVRDRKPDGPGQFGAALRYTSDTLDLGLYVLRYDAKAPQIFAGPGAYGLVYPRGIGSVGASFSTYAGEATVAGEISFRGHAPLVSRLPELGGAYAVGDTVQAQLSTTGALPPGRLWNGAQLAAEIAGNEVLRIAGDAGALLPGRDRFAASLRLLFSPSYFQVLPGLDVSVPLGVGIGVAGRSSIDGSQNGGAGDVELGLSATFRAVWDARVIYTRFVGGAPVQPLADRDFVSLSVARSF